MMTAVLPGAYLHSQRLPALDVLDTMNQRAATVGWVCLTIGLVAGFIWASQVPGTDPRVQAMSLQDPKIFVALISWVLYSFEVFAARRIGWGGRRAAYLSAVGFAIVLLNFLPISYFLTNSHMTMNMASSVSTVANAEPLYENPGMRTKLRAMFIASAPSATHG